MEQARQMIQMVLGDQGRKALPLDGAWWSYELLADMLVLKVVGISFDHLCQIIAKLRSAPTPSTSLVELAKQAQNPIAPTQDLVVARKENKKKAGAVLQHQDIECSILEQQIWKTYSSNSAPE